VFKNLLPNAWIKQINNHLSSMRDTPTRANYYSLKGQYHEIFDFRFLSRINSPKPLSIHLDRFELFKKFTEIFEAHGEPPVSLKLVTNEKIFNQKSFKYFVWIPLGRGSRVNM
jgi:hypothetical protein